MAISFFKKIWTNFFAGPQWRKDPPAFQLHRNGRKRKIFPVFLWYWINALIDLYFTRHARMLFLIWLVLTSYSLTMLPDSLPALWLFMSAAGTIDLIGKIIFRPKLSISRIMPQQVRCAVPFRVQYRIENHGILPCYALLPDTCFLCDDPADIGVADTGISTDIPRKTTCLHEIQYIAKKRGFIHCTKPVAETSYPLHIFKHSRLYGKRETLMVWPYCRTIPELMTIFSGKSASETDPAIPQAETASICGDSQDFYACRDYHTGDPPKQIHWRRSAQRNKLTVRENEKEDSGRVAVLPVECGKRQFDRILRFIPTKNKPEKLFEGAISLCASTLQTLEENRIPAELYLSEQGLSGDGAMDALATIRHGIEPENIARFLLREEKIRQLTGVFLIITGYNKTIADLRQKFISAGLPRVNFLLITSGKEQTGKLPDDITVYQLENIVPEVMQ